MKEKLLFVTKGGENCDEGFSYVLELAKTLRTDIIALVIYPSETVTSFEDAMVTVAFAEAGDFNTVKTLMDEQIASLKAASAASMDAAAQRCREASVGLIREEVQGDTMSSIRDILKKRRSIDMVLISPTLSSNRRVADIKKLIKHISKPIVAISRQAGAEA